MKNCPNCGRQIDDNALFCPYCGASADKAAGGPAAENEGAAPQNYTSGDTAQNYENVSESGHFSRDEQAVQDGDTSRMNDYVDVPPQNSGSYQSSYQSQQNYGYQNYGAPAGSFYYAKDRSIGLAILFSIITFGIYGLYWLYELNEGLAELTDDMDHTSGGLVVLFSIITFGIYGIYWCYKAGKKVDYMKGTPNGDSSIIYLLLSIFGVSIIAYALIQDNINNRMRALGLGRA
jgi:hypothetical protein